MFPHELSLRWTMGFIHFLVLSFGAIAVLSQEVTKCVPETARCRQFWTKIEPHRYLWETEKELNAWCRTQNRFYECLEGILLEGKNGNLSYLPINLLISKLFAKDLCSDGSHNRWRLLDNAACMNSLNTDYCTQPEYLDIVTADEAIPASRCSSSEKIFSCIAATLVLNCGYDAGRVYRNMLKITRYSDEVCGIEVTEGIPPCEEGKSSQKEAADRLSQIYYGLVHKMGSIPQEESEMQDSSEVDVQYERSQIDVNRAVVRVMQEYLDRIGSVPEEKAEWQRNSKMEGRHESEQIDLNQAVDVVQEYIDRIGSMQEVENEVQGSLKKAEGRDESERIDPNKVVTEALRNALNSLDDSMVEGKILDYMMADDPKHSEVNDEKELLKNPIITDVLGILFYNYSDVEYAAYWRQPDFTAAENISCEQLAGFGNDLLGCVFAYRYSDPDCLSNATVHEKVTPELIRDLDPEVPDDSIIEFGPRPHWMKDLDDAYEERRLRAMSTTREPLQFTESPIISTTAASLINVASSVAKKPRNWWDLDWMGKYTNSIIPNDLHREIVDLFLPEPEKVATPQIYGFKFGDFYYAFLYENRLAPNVEKATCSRLDECHPRGRGLWKCKALSRKKETCYGCDGSNELNKDSSVAQTTEPITVTEGSGSAESSVAFTSDDGESVKGREENSQIHDPWHDKVLVGYLSEEANRNGYLSEEDDLSETELKEAMADEINYKLGTETDKQLRSDFRLLLLEDYLHPKKLEHSSEHVDERCANEDDEDSDWAMIPEEEDDEPEYSDEEVVVIEPISEDKSKVEYAIFTTPDSVAKLS